MGEAKRRKQALGDRYGEIPPVLVDGSSQLEVHIRKFSEAFFRQFKRYPDELLARYQPNTEEDCNEQQSIQTARANEEWQNWLTGYLEPYRQQDREKVVIGFLLPIYASLYLDEKSKNQTKEDKERDFLMNLAMCLFSFNSLKIFLSESNQEEYGRALYKICSEAKTKRKANQTVPIPEPESVPV